MTSEIVAGPRPPPLPHSSAVGHDEDEGGGRAAVAPVPMRRCRTSRPRRCLCRPAAATSYTTSACSTPSPALPRAATRVHDGVEEGPPMVLRVVGAERQRWETSQLAQDNGENKHAVACTGLNGGSSSSNEGSTWHFVVVRSDSFIWLDNLMDIGFWGSKLDWIGLFFPLNWTGVDVDFLYLDFPGSLWFGYGFQSITRSNYDTKQKAPEEI